MEVRLVKPSEGSLRSEIFALRAAAYRKFIDDHVRHFSDAFDWQHTTWLFAVMEGKRVIGSMRVSVPPLPCGIHCNEVSLLAGNVVEVSRLCIEPSIVNPVRRFHIFGQLMREAIVTCRALNADFAVLCAARPSLENFYRKVCGFSVFAISEPPPPVTVTVKVMVAPVSVMLGKHAHRYPLIDNITKEEIATRLFHLGKKEAA